MTTTEETIKDLKDLREWLRVQVVDLNKAIKTLERMSKDENSTEESKR